jgi:hypothetical protein
MENLAEDPTLTPIEATALEMLLKGDDPVLAKLRDQCALMAVMHREFTRAGYVTRFKVRDSDSDPPQLEGSFDISDVVAVLPGDTDILMFHLAVRDGRLDYLEAVTDGEDWPTEGLDRARLMYFDKAHPKGRMDRNLVVARQQWVGTSH